MVRPCGCACRSCVAHARALARACASPATLLRPCACALPRYCDRSGGSGSAILGGIGCGRARTRECVSRPVSQLAGAVAAAGAAPWAPWALLHRLPMGARGHRCGQHHRGQRSKPLAATITRTTAHVHANGAACTHTTASTTSPARQSITRPLEHRQNDVCLPSLCCPALLLAQMRLHPATPAAARPLLAVEPEGESGEPALAGLSAPPGRASASKACSACAASTALVKSPRKRCTMHRILRGRQRTRT